MSLEFDQEGMAVRYSDNYLYQVGFSHGMTAGRKAVEQEMPALLSDRRQDGYRSGIAIGVNSAVKALADPGSFSHELPPALQKSLDNVIMLYKKGLDAIEHMKKFCRSEVADWADAVRAQWGSGDFAGAFGEIIRLDREKSWRQVYRYFRALVG